MSTPPKDPEQLTVANPFNYDATDWALQRQLMLAVMVAGKHAAAQERKLDQLLGLMRKRLRILPDEEVLPFEMLVKLRMLGPSLAGNTGADVQALVKGRDTHHPLVQLLQAAKTGQYVRLTWCFLTLAWKFADGMNLRDVTRQELVNIPGIGLKTASFFILFTRRGARMSCLDTHILAYMKEHKLAKDVPDTSPASEQEYLRLEHAFLAHCDKLQREPAELDFEIWKSRSTSMRRLRETS